VRRGYAEIRTQRERRRGDKRKGKERVTQEHSQEWLCHMSGEREGLVVGGFFFMGEAVVADAADFGAGDGDLHVEVAGDLFLELFVEAGFEFADFAAAETGYVDVVARAVSFVIVAVPAEVKEIELVDEAFFFEEIDGAVDGDEVDGGVHFLGAFEDLIDVEVLLGGIHDFEDYTALASEADSLFTEGFLEAAGGFGGVDAFAGRDTMCGRS
jgi:hypothetical protein